MKRRKCTISGTIDVEGVLGEGLSGRVYKAKKKTWSKGHQIPIALKVLKPGFSVHVFEKELNRLLAVQSERCVRVLGWEQTKFGPALLLEFIEGINLREFMKMTTLQDEEAMEICIQVLEGLLDLQRAGLCHGDLSASNIMLTPNGQIKLLDFANPEEKGLGDFGTKKYLSPERWSGVAPSFESDLFALGLIFFELTQAKFRFEYQGDWEKRARSYSKDIKRFYQTLQTLKNKDLGSRSLIQNNLGQKVRDLMSLKDVEWTETRQVSGKANISLGKRRRVRIGLAAALLTLSFSLSGDGRTFSKLVVTTSTWHRIFIDEEFKGYTPLEITSLPSGWVKVKLVNKKTTVVLKRYLRPGQTQLINDSDLRAGK